jgi:hypothetical protein
MPNQSKTKAKTKAKQKTTAKPAPEVPGITTKKSYWVMLTLIVAVAVSIAGLIINLPVIDVAILTLTVVLMIGLLGYVRVTPSSLSKSKRATFLFFGGSVIGFGIWAAIVLVLNFTGVMLQIANALNGDQFFVIPSFIIMLTVGAFIGELLGRNSRVQKFFFKPEDAL